MSNNKSSGKWVWIWLIIGVVVLLAYPGKTSFIAGWLPWSMIITFGLMWVVFVAAAYFSKELLFKEPGDAPTDNKQN